MTACATCAVPRRLPGWGRLKGSPRESLGLTAWETRGWIDHPYRLRFADGTTVYVSEPYMMEAADLADLAELDADGWDVWISGRGEHHADTVKIHAERAT